MLADRGHVVVVADADDAAARRVAAELGAGNGKHVAFGGDLTDRETNRRLVREAATHGTVTVVVNAVGISPKSPDGTKRAFHEITEDEWDRVMGVNVKAPLILIQEAYDVMPTDGTASIVNILSVTSKLGTGGPAGAMFPPHLPSSVAYGASKAALQNLTASLARELAGHRIRVNGVAPGFVDTTMTGIVPEKERLAAQVPLGRFANPDEVVGAIEFLVGPQASYITGTSIDVNGGWVTC